MAIVGLHRRQINGQPRRAAVGKHLAHGQQLAALAARTLPISLLLFRESAGMAALAVLTAAAPIPQSLRTPIADWVFLKITH